jgi:2-dehydro-3-deoxyphosphogluconate aldolase/(4S)-4-hydroxy-2-oxoglutarate aldolase
MPTGVTMNAIFAKHVIPVAVIDKAEDAVPLARALRAGGLNTIEVTFRTDAAEQAIRNIASAFPDMQVGAGTILSCDQACRAKEAGARFGVSPGLHETVVNKAAEIGLPFMPGVMTPSDVETALSLGCAWLKFFPADVAGGVRMLKALAGPYGHTGVRYVPLGGINIQNMAEYLALPNVAAIGGSWVADRHLIAAGNWTKITELTAAAVAVATAAGRAA